jgi:hypothetical protein
MVLNFLRRRCAYYGALPVVGIAGNSQRPRSCHFQRASATRRRSASEAGGGRRRQVFGESVLNDAVAIVLFQTLQRSAGAPLGWAGLPLLGANFAFIGVGSMAVGAPQGRVGLGPMPYVLLVSCVLAPHALGAGARAPARHADPACVPGLSACAPWVPVSC